MFARFFSRGKRLVSQPNRSSFDGLEGLEDRLLMTAPPKVLKAIADNRGEVQINFSRTVQGLSKNSAKLFTAGADNLIGTADDVRVPYPINYTPSNGRLTIKGKLAAGTTYRVRLDGKLITSLDGRRLDGEFHGASVTSGNGVPGGNFEFLAKNDKSTQPLARMNTSAGVMTIRFRKDVAPVSAQNFINYINAGHFDGIFFTRSEGGFVIQGGSLQIHSPGTTAADIIATPEFAAIKDENSVPGALSNTIGTLSFAKSGPNTATNSFFINMGNNSGLDSPIRPDGGFTVFADVIAGFDVAQTINAKPTIDLSNQIGAIAAQTHTLISDPPVNDATLAQNLNPLRDLQFVRKTAMQDKLVAIA